MGNRQGDLPLAALEHADDEHDMEDVLERVARRLQAEGVHVGGLVHRVDDYPSGSKRMVLFDLRSDRSFELSQDLGGASVACNLNPQALGEASAVLRQALADGVDLVVINRFGSVEAEGGGLCHGVCRLHRRRHPGADGGGCTPPVRLAVFHGRAACGVACRRGCADGLVPGAAGTAKAGGGA